MPGLGQNMAVDRHLKRSKADIAGHPLTVMYNSRVASLPIMSVLDFCDRDRTCLDASCFAEGVKIVRQKILVKDGGDVRIASARIWAWRWSHREWSWSVFSLMYFVVDWHLAYAHAWRRRSGASADSITASDTPSFGAILSTVSVAWS